MNIYTVYINQTNKIYSGMGVYTVCNVRINMSKEFKNSQNRVNL